jgi:dolichol-phosphate mannosyltransferase
MDLIVIPTYEEADSISSLLDRILATPGLDRFHVLVVDDASPDGTAALVRAHPSYGDRVRLLERPAKTGLGAAYRTAFAWAQHHEVGTLVQMDADGSHQPEAVPSLVAALRDADLVIGSRYVPGGRTVDWSRRRRLVSRVGNTYVRLVLGLPVRDCTAGFRAYRRRALDELAAGGTESGGYAFQIETTWRAAHLGLRIEEVPITFVERREGASKMTTSIVLEAVWRVLQWRYSCGRPSAGSDLVTSRVAA